MAVTITIANEKGGVGKTTTAVNLAAGLALKLSGESLPNNRVLLIDLDPQAHALMAVAFGKHQANKEESLAALLTESPPPSVQRLLQQSEYHPNLFYIPGNRSAMSKAARLMPSLMANETRLKNAIAPIYSQFSYIIIDTPPTLGDLLVNGLVAATHALIPVETSYLGVSGLLELQKTIREVSQHFRPDLSILGFLPTICEEQRLETREILEELRKRYPNLLMEPIHKTADLAYAHSSHMDIFSYRPPRQRDQGQLRSSSRATREYGNLVNTVLKKTWKQARK